MSNWKGLTPEQRAEWERRVSEVTSLNAGIDAQKTGGQLIQLAITKRGEKTDTLYRLTPMGWMYEDVPYSDQWLEVGDMEMVVYLNMTVRFLRLNS